MIYLLLAILSSTAVAVLMRLSGRFSKNGMTMRNMMGAESGGKRQASVTFAAMM